MPKIDDGGPAYPRLGEGFGNAKYEAVGLTKREYFAALAMQRLISEFSGTGGWAEDAAILAVAAADALLAALSKGQEHE
jgi:hypothetical protein